MPLTARDLAGRAVAAAVAGGALSLLSVAALSAVPAYRAGRGFELGSRVAAILAPRALGEAFSLLAIVGCAAAAGLGTAAALVARRGVVADAAERPQRE